MHEQLNAKFAIESCLSFVEGAGDLVAGRVDTSLCQAKFFLHGAHVAEFQPAGGKPLLFMSEKSLMKADAPIRGGVPICFPWFGPNPLDTTAPAHGYARIRGWDLLSTSLQFDGAVVAVLGLAIDYWKLEYTVSFAKSLTLSLKITNVADHGRDCEVALHTYFEVADISQTEIYGLEARPHLDKLTQLQNEPSGRTIRFDQETDRVYQGAVDEVTIFDEGNQRRINIRPTNSQSTVVWNPWIEKSKRMPDFGDEEYLKMCCVETANVAKDRMGIAAGESSTIAVSISENNA